MEGKRMKFENIKTYNFGPALRGMRNPLESWNKSDSFFGLINAYKHLPNSLDWEGLSKYGERILDIDEDYLKRTTSYLVINDIKPENFRTDETACLYCIDYGDFEIGNMRRTGVLNVDYK